MRGPPHSQDTPCTCSHGGLPGVGRIPSSGGLSGWLVLLLPLRKCHVLLAAQSCHADVLLAKKAALVDATAVQFWSQVGLLRLPGAGPALQHGWHLFSALAFWLFQALGLAAVAGGSLDQRGLLTDACLRGRLCAPSTLPLVRHHSLPV